jgi:hypothetical protein
MHQRWFQSVSFLSFAAMALAFPNAAAADVVNMDEFAVVNNGTQIFDDSFNRTLSLVGGSGTTLSSGTTFFNDTPANYHVVGTVNETTANNGQAVLDTANGFKITQPDPFIPTIKIDQAFLQTGSNLTPAHTFSTIGLFDLSVPTTVLGTYDVALTNQSPGSLGRWLQMRVRETNTGPILQFAWLDYVTNQFTPIDQLAITPAELTNPQIELALSLNTAGNDIVTAWYAFGSGNTLASFNGTLTAFGSTDSSTDLFTPAKDFAVAGFQAFTPVIPEIPEPSTWAMMLLGCAGVGFVGYRRAKRGRAMLAA